MARAVDVARYIVDRHPAFGEVRVQKLCYFAQGWTLAITDQPLFDDELQAWKMGPVSPAVHRAFAAIRDGNDGDPGALSAIEKTILDRVLREYRWVTTDDMIEDSHQQRPWAAARGQLPDNLPSTALIDPMLLHDEYSCRIHTLCGRTAIDLRSELHPAASQTVDVDLDEIFASIPPDEPEDLWGSANLFVLPA